MATAVVCLPRKLSLRINQPRKTERCRKIVTFGDCRAAENVLFEPFVLIRLVVAIVLRAQTHLHT